MDPVSKSYTICTPNKSTEQSLTSIIPLCLGPLKRGPSLESGGGYRGVTTWATETQGVEPHCSGKSILIVNLWTWFTFFKFMEFFSGHWPVSVCCLPVCRLHFPCLLHWRGICGHRDKDDNLSISKRLFGKVHNSEIKELKTIHLNYLLVITLKRLFFLVTECKKLYIVISLLIRFLAM